MAAQSEERPPVAHASCTWGEGPDVLVSVRQNLEWPPQAHLSGRFDAPVISFGLSVDEARQLAIGILVAAQAAEKIDREYAALMGPSRVRCDCGAHHAALACPRCGKPRETR